MAKIPTTKLKILDRGNVELKLGQMVTKAPIVLGRKTKTVGEEFRRSIINEAEKFKWKGTLINGIHLRKAKGKFEYLLISEAQHGTTMEFGVKAPHYLHKDMLSASGYSIGQWAKEKGVKLKRGKWLLVGGPNSRIKNSASMNKFWKPGIDNAISKKLPELALLDAGKAILTGKF